MELKDESQPINQSTASVAVVQLVQVTYKVVIKNLTVGWLISQKLNWDAIHWKNNYEQFAVSDYVTAHEMNKFDIHDSYHSLNSFDIVATFQLNCNFLGSKHFFKIL